MYDVRMWPPTASALAAVEKFAIASFLSTSRISRVLLFTCLIILYISHIARLTMSSGPCTILLPHTIISDMISDSKRSLPNLATVRRVGHLLHDPVPDALSSSTTLCSEYVREEARLPAHPALLRLRRRRRRSQAGVVRLESRKVPSERRENLDTASGRQ